MKSGGGFGLDLEWNGIRSGMKDRSVGIIEGDKLLNF
jgi:hypothetical protein